MLSCTPGMSYVCPVQNTISSLPPCPALLSDKRWRALADFQRKHMKILSLFGIIMSNVQFISRLCNTMWQNTPLSCDLLLMANYQTVHWVLMAVCCILLWHSIVLCAVCLIRSKGWIRKITTKLYWLNVSSSVTESIHYI